MDLEKLNLVELNAQEVQETEGGWGGAIVRGFKYLCGLARDWAVTEACSHAINNPLTPQQAADYYRYRRM